MANFDPVRVESLIRQIKEDREEFFKQIDPQIQQIVKKVSAQMGISEYYAEMLGSVYEKVLSGFDRFEGATWNELRTWMWRIAKNAAIEFITRTQRKMPAKEVIEDYGDAIGLAQPSHQEQVHQHLDLIQFFETLDPAEGFIFVLHSSFEYTFDEIARILKLPGYKARRMYLDAIKRFNEK